MIELLPDFFSQSLVLQIVYAFIGTVGYAVLFNVPKRFYLSCGFTGAAGWFVYRLTEVHTSAAVASFFGTLVVVLISRMLTVRLKCPITIFLVAGILPMVPGAGVYYTAYYLVTNQLSEAVVRGMGAVKVAFAIVLGIVCIVSIPREFFQLRYWRQRFRLNHLRRLRLKKNKG